jgi:hypothetical protein
MVWKTALALVSVLGWLCCVGAAVDATSPGPGVGAPQPRTGMTLGSRICVANAEITATRNLQTAAQPLDATAQYYLRPWFGDLVEKVRVIWHARLNDHLELAGRVFSAGSYAQTYGYQVYIASSQGAREPESAPQLVLLAHELVHTAQYVRYGEDLARFCHAYIQGWEQARGVYKHNPLEQEAFNTAFAFAQWLGRLKPAATQADSLVYVHQGDRQAARQTRIPRRLPRVDADRRLPLPPVSKRP